MVRYKLRTLLIVTALGPLLLAVGYFQLARHFDWLHRNDGPFIQRAKFIGNRAYSDKKLAKVIGLNQGIRLNAYAAGESMQKVKAFHVQQGYPQVKVEVLEGSRTGDKNLVYQIAEGEKRIP